MKCEVYECTNEALYIVTVVGNVYDNMEPGVGLYCRKHMIEAEKTADKCGVACVIKAYLPVNNVYQQSK